MPLRNLNKKIVKKGLRNFNLNNFHNFKKLFKLKNRISSTDIGFKLGPLLNSSSRLGYSELPIKLLTEINKNNINKISDRLVKLNEKRKNIQNQIFRLLNSKIEIIENEVIFKYETNINEGLLGIIAANFVEYYGCTIFFTFSPSSIF